MSIKLIVDTKSLCDFCDLQKSADFIAVDTEFIRDKTYYPILCLVQIAGPDYEAIIDACAPGIDLSPLADLLGNTSILKILHAGRQDNEIFFNIFGEVPKPIFDTQIAAMVCGFGDQVAYGTLIANLLGITLEKTSRLTDWSHRPLTKKQLQYAIADVTHLKVAYKMLANELDQSGRKEWLTAEMGILTDPKTYTTEPRDAWKRIKHRTTDRKFLTILQEIAAWREEQAQHRDVPRNRILRDESLLNIAAHAPKTSKMLAQIRGMPKGFAEGKMGTEVLKVIERSSEIPEENRPLISPRERLPNGNGPLTDLLKTLLKLRCEETKVAPKLIANVDDLERIAAYENADVPALKGWRREIFGEHALSLKRGRLALTAEGNRIKIININD